MNRKEKIRRVCFRINRINKKKSLAGRGVVVWPQLTENENLKEEKDSYEEKNGRDVVHGQPEGI